jgi:hypothetical protein
MKSKLIPQFELPVVGGAFNLASESTGDGERIARELRQAAAAKIEAARIEAQRQREFIVSQPEPPKKNQK